MSELSTTVRTTMKIATVAIYVEDQNKALKFWTEQVGFVMHRSQPMGDGTTWIEVGPKDSETCIVIYPKTLMDDWAKRKPSIVFECDHLQKTYEEMTARGVQFTQLPKKMSWGPFAIFLDTEGNWFGLREKTEYFG